MTTTHPIADAYIEAVNARVAMSVACS